MPWMNPMTALMPESRNVRTFDIPVIMSMMSWPAPPTKYATNSPIALQSIALRFSEPFANMSATAAERPSRAGISVSCA